MSALSPPGGGGGGPPREKTFPREFFYGILPFLLAKTVLGQGCYSETGFHIGMDCNFVCLWRRHNCNWSLPHSAPISWFMYEINYCVFNNSNLHAILSTLLIINLHWVLKIYFAVLEWIYNNVVYNNVGQGSFNLSQSFNYAPYLFCKKRFKSEINCFFIRTQQFKCKVARDHK